MKRKLLNGGLAMMSCLFLQSCASTTEELYRPSSRSNNVAPVQMLMDSPSETVALTTSSAESNNSELPKQSRTVLYSAELNLLVDDRKEADVEIRRMAKESGGWFQKANNRMLSLRVPVKVFDRFLKSLESVGTVTSKSVEADDVTEKFLDTELRLKNAEKTLQRLRDLYAKAKVVKDILLIEKEINRISEYIEGFKGKLKYWKSNAAYSTINVYLNQAKESRVAYNSPFYWMTYLGKTHNLSAGKVSASWSKIKVEWPEDFVALSHDKYSATAMTADGLFVKMEIRKVETKAKLSFWSRQAKNILQKTRLVKISNEQQITLKGGTKASMIQGAHVKTGYTLVIASSSDAVGTIEVWGPKDILKSQEESIKKLLNSIKLKL
mgnify:CR=1 FL=1